MRSAVVINPAKVDDVEARRAEICAALAGFGCPDPLWLETTPEDSGGGQTRQAIASTVDVVFVCGGDGTVMACAGELAGTSVAMCVLPAGTGNLLAANLDLPTGVADGVAAAVRGGRRRIDVGAVEQRCFTVMAGIGFDAAMMAATPEGMKKRLGWPAYVVGGLRRLRDRPMRLRLRLDGGRYQRRSARSVLVANVGRLSGGIPLLPDAEPDDGLLDVALLSPRHVRDWLVLGWSLVRHRPVIERVETFRARRVDVLADRPYPRELDGDVIEPGTRLSVVVRPGALTVCVRP